MKGVAMGGGVLAGTLVLAVCVSLWLRRRDPIEIAAAPSPGGEPGRQNKPLISLVLLLRVPRQLDVETLREAAEQAYDEPFGVDDSAENFVYRFQPNMYPVRVRGATLGVIGGDAPYVEESAAEAEKIEDPRLRFAVRAHRGWLSVDWFGGLEQCERPEAYRLIGRLVAELVGPDCLAVYATEPGAMVPYDASMKETLRGSTPMQLFTEVEAPADSAEDEDPRIKAAVAEARRRFPEFVYAFEERQPGQIFIARAPFHEEGATEILWLTVTALENDVIFGTLDEEPSVLKHLQPGRKMSFRLRDLQDWAYTDHASHHGGFTLAAVREAKKADKGRKGH